MGVVICKTIIIIYAIAVIHNIVVNLIKANKDVKIKTALMIAQDDDSQEKQSL